MNPATAIDLDHQSTLEWIESNGNGAYASSSMADCHTRRYHGLLVSPVAQHQGRHVLLSQLEAIITIADTSYNLATNYYPGAVHPHGYQYIIESNFEPCPSFVYDLDGVRIRREVFMAQDECAVYIRFLLEGPVEDVQIQLKPLISYRDSHSLMSENMFIDGKAHRMEKGLRFNPYQALPPLYLQYNQELHYYPGPCWEKNLCLPMEQQRGFDYQEDRFFPGVLEGTLVKSVPLLIRAGIENQGFVSNNVYKHELQKRIRNIANDSNNHLNCLRRHANCFFTKNEQNEVGIIAGYPWFGVWGRDTMLSLPGLCFYNNQSELGLDILISCGHHLRDGLLPNTFAGLQGKHAFNSIDASLLFCWAMQCFMHTHQATAFEQESERRFNTDLFPMLEHIVTAFINGKVPIAQLNEHGLISSGDANTQYTWMDARAYGRPVTPRFGFAVEINALWFNALSWYAQMCRQFDHQCLSAANDILSHFEQHFCEMFWIDEKGYLADAVNEHGQDHAIRPNQLFAASLPFSPLSKQQQQSMLQVIDAHLITPFGLRTLNPHHPQYRGRYEGSPDERDSCYHQGTVWPWLIGPYVEAQLRASDHKASCAEKLSNYFNTLFSEHIYRVGLGGISEIFDGDEPQRAKGCYTQAWSVAEAIRAQYLLQEALNQ